MSEHIAPPASRLYLVHRLEAEKVVRTENALFEASAEFVATDPQEPILVGGVREQYRGVVRKHKIAHLAFAHGVVRHRENYDRQQAAYQQEALEDAIAAGYIIEGWQQESRLEK